MRHIRVDDCQNNAGLKTACGLGPDLPPGDNYVFEGELPHTVDCRACLPTPVTLGTPISQLSGRPGHPGYEKFCAIAASWGYD